MKPQNLQKKHQHFFDGLIFCKLIHHLRLQLFSQFLFNFNILKKKKIKINKYLSTNYYTEKNISRISFYFSRKTVYITKR